MKLFSLVAALLIGNGAFAATEIIGWNREIPTTPGRIIDLLYAEAAYYSFDGDNVNCGGDVINPQLFEHSRQVTEDGNTVHEILVNFKMTQAQNYCANEETLDCSVLFQVLSESGVLMGEWYCR